VHDFRSFIELLEESGDLVRVKREVDRKYEMPAVISRLEKSGKAYLFEHVKGSEIPVVGGLLNGSGRLALALQRPSPNAVTHGEIAELLETAIESPLAYRVVDEAPVKEVINTGDAIDLAKIPVPTFFEFDSGPFITGAVGVSRNEEAGQLNVGFYRCQIVSKDSMIINASSMSDLLQIYAHAESEGKSMPIAMVIGPDPALLMCASGKHPPGVSELDIAGALQGRPIDMVKCETSDLLVPANAEIVIECRVDFSQKIENTLGEFADQYGPETAPLSKITAITHRRDAMFYTIMAGRHPEHNTIGAISTYGMQSVLAKEMKRQFPNIKEINVSCDPRLGCMLHVFVSIHKQNDEEPRELIKSAFKAHTGLFPVGTIVKRIVVVDEDIDVYNLEETEWAIWSRVGDASKYMVIPDIVSWEIERCAKEGQVSVRIGIDATKDLEDADRLIRPIIPGAGDLRIEDYVEPDDRH